MKQKHKVIIFTDGAAFKNPGPGGYAAILIYGSFRKEISKGFYKTTNNRMELMAVIEALRMLKQEGLEVIIYSDSKYVVDAIEKGWLFSWERKHFKKAKNPDLWRTFLKYYRKHHIQFRWVRGHAGQNENERCDRLAKQAAENPSKTDHGFRQKPSLY